ncbi:MAG: aminotransferase class V-fold PLP-dependent enzyme [Actinomycetota bacterium]
MTAPAAPTVLLSTGASSDDLARQIRSLGEELTPLDHTDDAATLAGALDAAGPTRIVVDLSHGATLEAVATCLALRAWLDANPVDRLITITADIGADTTAGEASHSAVHAAACERLLAAGGPDAPGATTAVVGRVPINAKPAEELLSALFATERSHVALIAVASTRLDSAGDEIPEPLVNGVVAVALASIDPAAAEAALAAAEPSARTAALRAVTSAPAPAPAMDVLLSPPEIGIGEYEAMTRALDSGWIAPAGPELNAFEAELSAWVDDHPVVALGSGTAAIHLALLAAGTERGDEVVVQTATFAATAFAVHHAGAVPVFCDVENETGNLDPDLLAELLAHKAAQGRLPAAVIAVDLYGLCADYERLRAVCAAHDVPLIQDSAESLGSRAQGTAAGAHATFGVLSFNGNKIITTSGGGALTGPAEALERARYLSTQARMPALHYEHAEVGYNYRLSNLLAALGRAQLATLGDRIERKAQLDANYVEALPELGWIPRGVTERWNHWLTVAVLPAWAPPHLVCRRLAAAGVEARPYWKPMHSQPVFAEHEVWRNGNADRAYARGICLPSGFGLSDADQNTVIEALRTAIR